MKTVKKGFSILLAAVLLSSAVSFTVSAETDYQKGDVNRDSVLNYKDVLYYRYYLAMYDEYEIDLSTGDYDDDGDITVFDMLLVYNHVLTLYEIGDINNDGVIDSRDIQHLKNYLNGDEEYELLADFADVNRDSNVDQHDFTALNKLVYGEYIAGDMNEDGTVDMDDAYILQAVLTNPDYKLPMPPEKFLLIADINGDQQVQADDLDALCGLILKGHITGDVNLDGSFDVKDVTFLQKWLAAGVELPYGFGVYNLIYDMNGDEVINIKDATYLQRMLLGL